jgi:uncharacterized protein
MNERLGPLDLLVVQPTPFCNLDCSYCYLPDRGSKRRIRPETLERIFERFFESDLVTRPFTVVWHAGEPLVLPPAFYGRSPSPRATTAISARHSIRPTPPSSMRRGGFIRRHDIRSASASTGRPSCTTDSA